METARIESQDEAMRMLTTGLLLALVLAGVSMGQDAGPLRAGPEPSTGKLGLRSTRTGTSGTWTPWV